MRDQEILGLYEAYNQIYEKTEEQVIDEDLQGAVEKGLDAAAKNPVVKAIGKVIAPVGKGRKTPTKASGGYRPVAKEEVEIIDEEPVQDYRDMKRAKENAAGIRGPELSHSTKSTGGSGKQKATKPEPRSREFAHKEEVETDLFDIVLEYLVAEGYADTNEAALVIMANMSEEWRLSIVEQAKDLESPDYKAAKRTMDSAGSGNKPYKGSGYQGGKSGTDKLTGMPVKGA